MEVVGNLTWSMLKASQIPAQDFNPGSDPAGKARPEGTQEASPPSGRRGWGWIRIGFQSSLAAARQAATSLGPRK